jgi:DNA replication protein DnaC
MSTVTEVRPALMGHLRDLHLPTVRECYEETARRAERETLSYEQYLLEVMARECEQRRKSKVQRLLKDSALPLEKSLQNFNLKRLPAKAARQLRTLLEGGFLDRKRKRSGVRQSWVGEESSFKRAGPGTGSGGGA